ncbi:acetylornithine deacetylase [uncultured Aliiroseovarius sp.]|uniref:acetylornithine deacetylase n=1 Tax=uncultured Aliiroseovarius sp. TaxID=1658783 RepID=UPI00259952FE|nr:acetylornithine deacetylase [uncultured Aliiroseovarius sp.]
MTHPTLKDAKAHLGRLIAFDTTSALSNRAIVDHMADYFAELGADITILPDDTGEKANLIARFGPAGTPGVVLSGHTDVVPARAVNWATPPFQMDERDGRLYGRGSCDMKGFAACVMAAAPEMARADLKRPLYLCFSHDEEVGCLGAPAIAQHLAALDVPPMLAIIGEPSEMKLVTGQKGKIAMRAHVRGTAGHSSFAPQHVNALEYAARIIGMIQDRGRAYAENGPFDHDFTVPHATMLATMIDGGVATNVTPDRCTFTFELRSIDETRARVDMDALLSEVENRMLPEMHAISPDTGIEWEEIFAYPAMGDATGTPGFEALRDILPEWGGKVSYGSEGGVFEVIGGIPSIIAGPGSIQQAHKADEFVEISQMDDCLHFLDKVVSSSATG